MEVRVDQQTRSGDGNSFEVLFESLGSSFLELEVLLILLLEQTALSQSLALKLLLLIVRLFLLGLRMEIQGVKVIRFAVVEEQVVYACYYNHCNGTEKNRCHVLVR